tara:strand:+ start:10918 stop:11091 length:174 start_codon:yes stop_codon:yes gene_type:complete
VKFFDYTLKWIKRRKKRAIWLQVPTDHKSQKEAAQCYLATKKLLEQILLNNNYGKDK